VSYPDFGISSAATPTAASVIALVNDALLAAGKPVLGFLNPWIYSVGNKAFTDVTNGSSIGCNTTGFPAAQGWDAVSGFGTPVSTVLLSTLKSFENNQLIKTTSISLNSRLSRLEVV
jgi:subtilase family serine protease